MRVGSGSWKIKSAQSLGILQGQGLTLPEAAHGSWVPDPSWAGSVLSDQAAGHSAIIVLQPSAASHSPWA